MIPQINLAKQALEEKKQKQSGIQADITKKTAELAILSSKTRADMNSYNGGREKYLEDLATAKKNLADLQTQYYTADSNIKQKQQIVDEAQRNLNRTKSKKAALQDRLTARSANALESSFLRRRQQTKNTKQAIKSTFVEPLRALRDTYGAVKNSLKQDYALTRTGLNSIGLSKLKENQKQQFKTDYDVKKLGSIFRSVNSTKKKINTGLKQVSESTLPTIRVITTEFTKRFRSVPKQLQLLNNITTKLANYKQQMEDIQKKSQNIRTGQISPEIKFKYNSLMTKLSTFRSFADAMSKTVRKEPKLLDEGSELKKLLSEVNPNFNYNKDMTIKDINNINKEIANKYDTSNLVRKAKLENLQKHLQSIKHYKQSLEFPTLAKNITEEINIITKIMPVLQVNPPLP